MLDRHCPETFGPTVNAELLETATRPIVILEHFVHRRRISRRHHLRSLEFLKSNRNDPHRNQLLKKSDFWRSTFETFLQRLSYTLLDQAEVLDHLCDAPFILGRTLGVEVGIRVPNRRRQFFVNCIEAL